MTTQDAINWLNSELGQYRDFDGQYKAQCVDFFNFYYRFLTGRNPYTDGYGVPGAKDLWNVGTSLFTKIPDSASLKAEPGDIMIYGPAWGGGYGHVEVALGSDANGTTVIGNNLFGNPAANVQKTYRSWAQQKGLLGVMRFNGFGQGGGGDEMINDSHLDVLRIAHSEIGGWDFARTHAGEFDKVFLDAWRGRPIADLVRAQWNAPQLFRNTRESWHKFYDQWNSKTGELSTRPTKAEYDKLLADMKAEQAKVLEAQAKLSEELARPPVEVTKPFTDSDGVNWLKSLWNRIFKKG